MNTFRTGLLLAAMTALFLAAGWLMGGQGGLVIAFVIAAAMNFFAYWNADKIVLSMYRAKQVDRNSAPGFYGIVEQLVRRADLPFVGDAAELLTRLRQALRAAPPAPERLADWWSRIDGWRARRCLAFDDTPEAIAPQALMRALQRWRSARRLSQ